VIGTLALNAVFFARVAWVMNMEKNPRVKGIWHEGKSKSEEELGMQMKAT
jgi:hypothetical protein